MSDEKLVDFLAQEINVFPWLEMLISSLVIAGLDSVAILLIKPASTGALPNQIGEVALIFLFGLASLGLFLFVFDWYADKSMDQISRDVSRLLVKREKSSHSSHPSASTETWVQFFEGRLGSWSAWVQALVSVGGVLPLSTFLPGALSGLDFLSQGGLVFVVTLVLIAFIAWIAARFLWRRRALLLLEAVVLGGGLSTDPAVAAAYLVVSTA